MSRLAESVRRQRARPGAGAAFGSILIHAAALAGMLGVAASAPNIEQFVSYDIELVSMSGPDLGDLVVEAPPSPPSEAPPPEPQPVVKEPEPEPRRETPAEPPPPSPTPPRQTQARPNPSSGASTGAESAESINIRMEGLRRDYPAYYSNIILQIKRCFRWQGQGSPEVELYFVINADGTVSDLEFVRKSGNPSFDYDALGAIECAGTGGRLGELPENLGLDRLPIRFKFSPGTLGGA